MKQSLVSSMGTVQAGKYKKSKQKSAHKQIFHRILDNLKKQCKLKRECYSLLSKIKNYYRTLDASLLNSIQTPEPISSIQLQQSQNLIFLRITENTKRCAISFEYFFLFVQLLLNHGLYGRKSSQVEQRIFNRIQERGTGKGEE